MAIYTVKCHILRGEPQENHKGDGGCGIDYKNTAHAQYRPKIRHTVPISTTQAQYRQTRPTVPNIDQKYGRTISTKRVTISYEPFRRNEVNTLCRLGEPEVTSNFRRRLAHF